MFQRIIASILVFTFILTDIVPPSSAQVSPSVASRISSGFSSKYPVFNGIKIYPQEPFRFDFIITDAADAASDDSERGISRSEEFPLKTTPPNPLFQKEGEYLKLIKYFMSALAIPEGDLWVNLSPDEPDRIVPQALGQTEMGRDLLAQDYVLKQLTAALLSPEHASGKELWEKIYTKTYEQTGSTDLSLETMSRVWIVPGDAEIYQNGDTAYIVKATLKVMMEGDYFSQAISDKRKAESEKQNQQLNAYRLTPNAEIKSIIRSVIIPVIEDEVNNGESFANLRQIYHSMILAKWFKQNLRNSVIGQVYADQKKTSGIQLLNSSEQTQQIYQNYLQAFQAGLDGLVKEEYNPDTQDVIARKYIVGGFDAAQMAVRNVIQRPSIHNFSAPVIRMKVEPFDSAMLIKPWMEKRGIDAVLLAGVAAMIWKFQDFYPWYQSYASSDDFGTMIFTKIITTMAFAFVGDKYAQEIAQYVDGRNDFLDHERSLRMMLILGFVTILVYGEYGLLNTFAPSRTYLAAILKSLFYTRFFFWANIRFTALASESWIWKAKEIRTKQKLPFPKEKVQEKINDFWQNGKAFWTAWNIVAFKWVPKDLLMPWFNLGVLIYYPVLSLTAHGEWREVVRQLLRRSGDRAMLEDQMIAHLSWPVVQGMDDVRDGGVAFSIEYLRPAVFKLREGRYYARLQRTWKDRNEPFLVDDWILLDESNVNDFRWIPGFVYLDTRLSRNNDLKKFYLALENAGFIWNIIRSEGEALKQRFNLNDWDIFPGVFWKYGILWNQWYELGYLEQYQIDYLIKKDFFRESMSWEDYYPHQDFPNSPQVRGALEWFAKLPWEDFEHYKETEEIPIRWSDVLMIKNGFIKRSNKDKTFARRVLLSYEKLNEDSSPEDWAMLGDSGMNEKKDDELKEKLATTIEEEYWTPVYGYSFAMPVFESKGLPGIYVMAPNENADEFRLVVDWAKEHLGDVMWPFTVLENVRIGKQKNDFVIVFQKHSLVLDKTVQNRLPWMEDEIQRIVYENDILDLGLFLSESLAGISVNLNEKTAGLMDFRLEWQHLANDERYLVKQVPDLALDEDLSIAYADQEHEGFKFWKRRQDIHGSVRNMRGYSVRYQRPVIFTMDDQGRETMILQKTPEDMDHMVSPREGYDLNRVLATDEDRRETFVAPSYVLFESGLEKEQRYLRQGLYKALAIWRLIAPEVERLERSYGLKSRDILPWMYLRIWRIFDQWKTMGYLEGVDVDDLKNPRKHDFLNEISSWEERYPNDFANDPEMEKAFGAVYHAPWDQLVELSRQGRPALIADALMIKQGYWKNEEEFKVRVKAAVSILLENLSDDAAMLHAQQNHHTGGIDMNSLNVKTQGEMMPVRVQVDPAMMNVQGFNPVIIDIRPMMTHQFLGWVDGRGNKTAEADFPQDKLPEKEHLYTKEI